MSISFSKTVEATSNHFIDSQSLQNQPLEHVYSIVLQKKKFLKFSFIISHITLIYINTSSVSLWGFGGFFICFVLRSVVAFQILPRNIHGKNYLFVSLSVFYSILINIDSEQYFKFMVCSSFSPHHNLACFFVQNCPRRQFLLHLN